MSDGGEFFVEGPASPIRWPHDVSPDHRYWRRGQVEYQPWASHVRDVGPTGGVWTAGAIGDCPAERGCPQCLVAAEFEAQADRLRNERGGIAVGDRSGRAEVVLLVPKFGVAAALAIAENIAAEGLVLQLGAWGSDRRGRKLAATLSDLIDGHRSAELSVSIVSSMAGANEIELYRKATAEAFESSGRPSGSPLVWDLAETYKPGRFEVGRQDAVQAFSDRYAEAGFRLKALPEVRTMLEDELAEYRAGRRQTIDDTAGVATDALLIAAGIALHRLDKAVEPPTVTEPPIGWSIYGDPADGEPWGRHDLY